ncbi:ABC transporter permease [Agarilytica rhodophyticola]|uniref:ABC transporter permease n=1 Tax=Agarilytica rhodophyticola TaxID=1737490 RepID=UPI000B34118C|nr:hypothetical protein [Agarilytica rhodophyticola]
MRQRSKLSLLTCVGLLSITAGTVILGLLGILAPAFGHLPAINRFGPSLQAWQLFLQAPGIGFSLFLSLSVGLISTFCAFVMSQSLLASLWGKKRFIHAESISRLLLATPHVAVALSLIFLLSPSGFLMRLISPVANLTTPLDYLFPGDSNGLALILGLILKETPFLIAVSAIAARDTNPSPMLAQAASLGYGRIKSWLMVVTPQLYTRIRLPIFAALAFATTTIEQALILGPTIPATLAVRLLQWFNDPDLAARLPLAAGAIALALCVIIAFALWRLGEYACSHLVRYSALRGKRNSTLPVIATVFAQATSFVLYCTVVALLGLGLTAFIEGWRFPDILPTQWTLKVWARSSFVLQDVAINTLSLGIACAIIAPTLALVGLQASAARPRFRMLLNIALFLPLFIPEATIIFGLNVAWSTWRMDGQWLTVLWAHLIYCLPYAWLTLAGPHKAIDPRLLISARVLGLGPWATFFRVSLPLLTAPIFTAAALCVLISVSLYLPTLVASAGRLPTLITESIALASGGDRRSVAVMMVLLVVLPLLVLEIAHRIPKIIFRHRRALSGKLS